MTTLSLPTSTGSDRVTQALSTPSHHKALISHSNAGGPLEITTQPVPQVTSGSAIVKVTASSLLSYTKDVYDGTRNYPHHTPFVPGSHCVGEIMALGSDATSLAPGDHVAVDMFIRGRDDPEALALQGLSQGFSEGSARLVKEEFRNGSFAEYVRVPLENCLRISINERNPLDWCNFGRMLVSFGGLTNDGGLDLRPGETVVVAPATGQFGGAAVEVALAMGANVVALGRNAETLAVLQKDLSEFSARLKMVQMSGDAEKDAEAIGPVECYFDISPPEAAESSHIKSCFTALKPHGRVCFMGSVADDYPFPMWKILAQSITMSGKFMYEANAARKLAKMVDNGLLKLDRYHGRSFPLEDWQQAFDHAKENMRWGQLTVLTSDNSLCA